MACRAVHFAITEEEARNLGSLKQGKERLAYSQEQTEQTFFSEQPEKNKAAEEGRYVLFSVDQ